MTTYPTTPAVQAALDPTLTIAERAAQAITAYDDIGDDDELTSFLVAFARAYHRADCPAACIPNAIEVAREILQTYRCLEHRLDVLDNTYPSAKRESGIIRLEVERVTRERAELLEALKLTENVE